MSMITIKEKKKKSYSLVIYFHISCDDGVLLFTHVFYWLLEGEWASFHLHYEITVTTNSEKLAS